MKQETEALLAIYSRKSRFTGKGESIENQIGLCREYIRLHFGQRESETCLVYEDEGFSGGNLDRPRFKAMMQDAAAGRFRAVVVYRLDRISRNIGDFAGLIEQLNDLNISFISIREQFDTRSPMGRAMMYIASVFSQLERETIAERIRDNMRELAKTGRWLGGTTPFGYCSEGVSEAASEGRSRKTYRLRLVPEEAEIVRKIFEIFLSTGSLKETEQYLTSENLKTRQEKPFGRFAIKGILSNPVYMAADRAAYDFFKENGVLISHSALCFDGRRGVMVYNRTLQQKGKASRQRELREWIAAAGAHEYLVTGRDWLRVREMLEGNQRKTGRRKSGENKALLADIIYCGCCNSSMRVKLSGKAAGASERRFSYLCREKETNCERRCSVKNAGGILLDQGILELLGQLPENEAVFFSRLEAMIISERKNHKAPVLPEQLLMRQEAECEKEIKNLLQVLAATGVGDAACYLTEQIDRLHEKRKHIKEKLVFLREDMRTGEAGAAAAALVLSAGSFKGALAAAGTVEKRYVIRSLVKRVVWDGEKAQVYFFDAYDTIDNKLPFGYTVEHK